jgi:hypothetical protein
MTDIASPTRQGHAQLQTLPERAAEPTAGLVLAIFHGDPYAIPASALRRVRDHRRALRKRTGRKGAR